VKGVRFLKTWGSKQNTMSENRGTMMHPNGLPIEETVSHIRRGIKAYAVLTKDCLKDHPHWHDETAVEDPSEVKANLMLCYRHLEDAAMRLGKVLQAKNGGKSVYNK
jgi:hypothetical protein